MFYLPVSLSFLFSYSSTILLFSFLKFFIPSFAILLCSFPFHHLVYSIYFSIHKKNRPHIDPTSTLHSTFFFCNTASWKVKKNHHISIVFPSLPHFYCFPSTTTTFLLFLSNTTTTTTTTALLFLSSTTTTTTTTFLLFSLLLLFCYLSLVFLAWGWLVWPVSGLWPSKGQKGCPFAAQKNC